MGKNCSKEYRYERYTDIMHPIYHPKIPEEKLLYVVLPYFNFCKFERRTQLFLEFIERVKNNPLIRIIVSEASNGAEFLLPRKIPGVFLHLGFTCTSKLWIKENLINQAVKHLPKNWRYLAWIDADLTFLSPTWAEDTIYKLSNEYDVVQLFSTCVNMGPKGETLKVDRSFGYMYRDSGKKYHKTAKYGFWHPGFAWACNRFAYDTMEGLVDWGILGSGDRHMALALIGMVDSSHPGNIHENYKKKLIAFQERIRTLRLGWVLGTILHHWHGRIEDRKYQDRWNILTKQQYDPEADICKGKNGLLQLTESGKRMEEQIINYFQERREDNMNP